MAGYQDLLDQYSQIANNDATSIQTQPSLLDLAPQKQAQVAQASEAKRAKVAVTDKTSGVSPEDVRSMSYSQLVLKYGQDRADIARQRRIEPEAPARTGADNARDLLTSAGQGGVGLVGSMGQLATAMYGAQGGLGGDKATAWISENEQAAKAFLESTKTDQAQQEQRDYELRRAAADEASQAQYDAETQNSGFGGKAVAFAKQAGRDIATTFEEASPENAANIVAQAVPSLLGGGIEAKLVQVGARKLTQKAVEKGVINKLGTRAAGILDRTYASKSVDRLLSAAAKARMPAVIAHQESAGVFDQTYADMKAKGFSDVDARDAGLKAAAIQAPIAAGLGLITGVGKFEANPLNLKRAVTREAFLDPIRETVEEGLQGASGQVSQNYSEQGYDPNQSIGEGVGQQTAEGAVGGFGSAVGAKALTAPVAIPAAIAGATINGVASIGAKGRAKVSDAIDGLATAKDRVAQFGQDIANGESLDPETKARVGGYADRVSSFVGGFNVDTIKDLAKVARDKTAPIADQISAAIRLKKQVEEAGALSAEPEAGDVNAATNVWDHVDTIVNSAPVQQAVSKVKALVEQYRAGNLKLNDPKSVAEAIKTILFHEEQGDLFLTPEERQDIDLSQQLIDTQQEYQTQTKEIKAPVSPDVISNAIQLDSGDKKQPSAAEHMQLVVNAMRAGNTEEAARQLNQFMNFAKVLNNKVGALNLDLENPEVTGPATGTQYLNYTSRGVWRMSNLRMFVNRSKPGTFKFARQVANDAQAVTTLANNLAVTFPDLGIEALTLTELNPEIKGEVPVKQTTNDTPNVATEAAAPSSSKGGDQSTATEVIQPQEPTPAKAEAAPAASEASSKERATAERRSKSKAATETISKAKPGEMISVRPFPEQEPDYHRARYVTKDGQVVDTTYTYDDETKHIDNLSIGDTNNPSNVGGPEIKTMFDELQKLHPEATKISGYRMTGARKAAGKDPAFITRELKPLGQKIDAKLEPEVVQAPEEIPVETTGPTTAADDGAASDVRGSEPVVQQANGQLDVSLQSVFPNLIGSSLLGKAFKLAKRTKTRVFGKATPVQLIVNALKSQEAFEAFIGKANRRQITPAIAGAYNALFRQAVGMAATLDNNLQKFLTKNAVQIKSGEAMLWLEGKAYNLVQENEDGSMGYNPELLGSALLAGFQWALTSNRYQANLDAEDVSKILKIDQALITNEQVAFMRQGAGITEVKRQMADAITRYWGMDPNPNEDISLGKGIAEAIAGEIIEAMIEAGLMASGVETPTLRMKIGEKTVDRYQTIPFAGTPLGEFPTAIEEAMMIDPEVDIYVGEKPTKVAQTQLNNPQVPNTPNQQEAIKAEQDTAFNLVSLTTNSILGMGKDLVLRLFGEGDLSKRVLNEQHKKTLEGRNQTLGGAFDALVQLKDRVTNATDPSGDPYTTDVHFPANLSSIGRMQIAGGFNAQSSKLIREALVPAKSVLNLSRKNTKDFARYGLALAQALGLKVENLTRKQAVDEIIDQLENGKFAPAIKILTDHLTSKKALSTKDIEAIREIFGEPLEVVSFHALLDYASLKLSKTKAQHETGLYVEADGVTNGPSNAVMLLTPGAFTVENLKNMAKGGIFLLKNGLTMNQHRQTDEGSIDFYTKASNKLKSRLVDLRNRVKGPAVIQQMNSLEWLMGQFLPGVTINEQGEVEVDRKVTKNPMTITLYGSGAPGIAGNLTYELTNEIYARLSEALEQHKNDPEISLAAAMFGKQSSVNRSPEEMLREFQIHIDNLSLNRTSMQEQKGRDRELATYPTKDTRLVERMGDPSFKFDDKHLDNMSTSMRWLFVEPMRGAISDTVGTGLMGSLKLLQTATQIMGVVGKWAFRNQIAGQLEGKNFPSQKDTDQAWDEALKFGLRIESGDQTFMPSGSEKFDIGSREFGRPFNGKLRTDAYLYGPENPGVSGIPTMVVGMGDGSMIQRYLTTAGNVLRSTRVFDGINLPLDQLEEGSIQANKAAWDAMIGNNPMKAVLKSFEQLLSNDWSKVADQSEAAEEIARALGVTTDEIAENMQLLRDELSRVSKDIDARHAVLARVNVSVDQMASVGSPYQQDGDINLDGLSENEAASILNEAYDEERTKLDPKESPEEIGEEIKAIGSNDLKTGVTTVSFNQLKSLLAKLKIPDEQKTLLREIVRSLATKKYRIAAGALSQLGQWAEKNAGQAVPTAKPGRSIKGFMSVADKIIYLVNSSSETLTHELLHAATFEKLVGYYAGTEKPSPFEVEAIKRIEALMSQFLELEDVSFTQRQAYDNAKREIEIHLKSSDAVSKAAAVNEFMAWALSNRDLIQLQKQTVIGKLAEIGKALLEEIKSVVFGRRTSPKIANDMYSNLRFNTSILLGEAPSVEELIGGRLLFQATSASEDIRNIDQLNKVRDVFHNKINQYLDWKLTDLNAKSLAFSRATQLAKDTATTFEQHFNMTPDQVSTFTMVVAALSTQAKLDPNSLAEIQDLFRITTDQLTPETFKNDPTSTDPHEDFVARGRFDAIVGNFTRQKDSEGRSTLLSGFLALSMVNPEFRQVLAKIKLNKPELEKWNSTDGIINNAGFVMMEKLGAMVSGADRNAPDVAAAIAALTHSMVEAAQDRVSIVDRVLGPVGSFMNRSNEVVVEGMQLLGKGLNKTAEAIENKTTNRVARSAANLLNVAAALIDETQVDDIHTGLISRMNRTPLPAFFKEVISEAIGRTLDNAGVYDLIKITRSKVQQVRQQFREQLPVTIASKFSRELSEDEWSVLYKGLAKTDLAALKSSIPVSRIIAMLQDPNRVLSEISNLEDDIKRMDSTNQSKILKKAKELAEWMNTGVAQSENPLRNANAVANLYGEVRPGSSKASPQLVKAVDQLVTLYALRGLPEGIAEQLQSLARDEAEGTSFALSYMVGQRADEQSKVDQSGLAKANHYKGFIPSESQKPGSLVVAENGSDYAQRLIAMGYKQIGNYEGSKAEPDLSRSYYWSPISAKAAFRQGIMQNVRPTASGVDPLTGFTNITTTAGQIVDPQNVATIKRNLKLNTGTKEHLLPVYNESGHVVAFERAIDPEQEMKLDRNTNLGRAIGVWAGRQAEELHAVAANQALIGQLKKMYDRDALTRQDEYVNLFGKLDDPVLRDAAGLINKATRNFIESTYGEKDEFWVRKDMLLDTIGARRASVGDFWTGNTRWSPAVQKLFKDTATKVFGDNAYTYLVKAESFWQNIITDARVTIVVKSVIVPMANLAANYVQLMSRGLNPLTIARSMPKKAGEVNTYIKNRVRKIELEAELRAVENDPTKSRRLRAEIQSLSDAERRLTIWPLIQAGELSSISDVAVSRDEISLAEGRLQEYIEKLTDKLPASMKTLGRYAIVAKDTALFKGLQRTVEYGDFLGKAVLYDHLTQNKGMSSEDAIANVSDEFINYDRLSGRQRDYLESVGLLWFWNFKIRSAKIALNMIRNNPVNAALALMIPGLIGMELPGSPVTDNGFMVMADGRLSYSLGFDQLAAAHSLNPWLQMAH